MSFAAMMALQARGEDRFSASGPGYPWGFIYGGQVVAHAVRAAAATVRSEEAIHSLHAYYVRPGDDGSGVDLVVARVRDGRSFSVRSVTVSQAGRALASVVASFHAEEPSEDRTVLTAPAAPPPDQLRSDGWSTLFERRYAPTAEPERTLVWIRLREAVGDDRVLHACALSYLADDIFDDPVIGLLGIERSAPDALAGENGSVSTQSLDYSIWFHRPVGADDWLLLDYRCRTFANACATVVGEAYDRAGVHVATMAQQVLVRRR